MSCGIAQSKRAFTLIELLVVMGIIAILLVVTIPAVTSLSKSGGRKTAISSLIGAIEQARAEATKSGEKTYVVFPTFSASAAASTLDRYNYRAYAIFRFDPANPTQPKQLTSWKTLPIGVSLRHGSLAALPDTAALSPPITIAFPPDASATPDFRCIQFDSTGAVELPNNDVTLVVFEGAVNGAAETVTSEKDASGNPLATESLKLSRLTGRANRTNL